jgi:hypothetical protein
MLDFEPENRIAGSKSDKMKNSGRRKRPASRPVYQEWVPVLS